jgi:N-acetyl-gamma-glutamyl-phosphate reductase
MDRGILSTIYALPCEGITAKRIEEIWREFYRGAPFVRVTRGEPLPSTAFVRGTNVCHFSAVDHARGGRVILVSALDNLVKGASGQAIQTLNRMQACGRWPSTPSPAGHGFPKTISLSPRASTW